MLDAYVPGQAGGTGERFDWSLAGEHPRQDAADPLRRDPARQRRRGDRRPCSRSRSTARAGWRRRPGARTPTSSSGCSRPFARRAAGHGALMATSERRGALRPLRRPLRAGDPDAGARRARAGLGRGERGPGSSSERLDRLLSRYAGRPTPLYEAERLSERGGLARLPEARGPAPHRRPQDQQCAGPGFAGRADGQGTDHRGDRRRAARRRDRHGLRAARPRMRRLHGHRGHAAPAAERRAHASCSARPSSRSRPARAR